MNGERFNGSITLKEAKDGIFVGKLGLSINLIHSIKMSFAKCRTITFKLSEQINVDQLAEKVNFNLKREYRTGTGDDSVMNEDVIECKLLGVRQPRTTPQLKDFYR